MSATERKHYIQWLNPTEDEALARLRHANKKPRTALLNRIDAEINRLLGEVREGRMGNQDFWIRRSRILKGKVL